MKIFSGNRCSANFAGIPIESGKGQDVFITIEAITEEAFITIVGLDSEVARSETGDNRHKVTVTIMQTSDHNDQLSAIHLLDRKSGNGAGVAPFMARDQNGRSVIVDPEAFIAGWPKQEWGKEPKDQSWVFICPNPERVVGGN